MTTSLTHTSMIELTSDRYEHLQRVILEKIALSHPLSDILSVLCVHVEQLVPGSMCFVMRRDEHMGVLRMGAVPSGGETAGKILDGLGSGEYAEACEAAAHNGTLVVIDDTETDSRWAPIRDAAQFLGIKSCWSTPIVFNGHPVLGTFAISHKQPQHPPKDEHLEVLKTSAYLAGIAIQRQEADETVQKNAIRFRDLYESAPLAYISSNFNGNILTVNHQASALLGYPPQELIGQSVLKLYAPISDGLEKAKSLLRLAQKGKETRSEELVMCRRDGTYLWVSLSICVIKHADKESLEFRGIIIDISSRKQTEALHRLERSTLESIALGESLPNILDHLCRHVEAAVHDTICSVLLFNEDRQTLRFAAGPSVSPEFISVLDRLKPGPCAATCGTALFRGTPVYVSNTTTDPLWADFQNVAKQFNIQACWSHPVFSEGKRVLGTFAISSCQPQMPSPFTIQLLESASYLAGIAIQQRENQCALEESEQRYRMLYDNNPSMHFTIGLDGTILSVNEFGAQELGYTPSELKGQSHSFLFDEDNREIAQDWLARCIANPEHLHNWEIQKIRKDGRQIWVRETARIVKDHEKRDVCLINCKDITDWKRSEHERRTLQYAIDQAMEGVGLHDKDGLFVYVNPAEASMYGFTPEELMGKSWKTQYDDKEIERIERESFPILQATGKWRGELVGRRKDGSTFDVQISLTSVIGQDHQFAGLICTCSDITERKRAENQRRASEQAIRELYEITSSPDTTFAERVQSLLHLGSQRFNLPIGACTRLEDDTLHFPYVASMDTRVTAGMQLTLAKTYCAAVLTSDEPLVIEHAARTEWANHDAYQTTHLEAYFGTKVMVGPHVYGSLSFVGFAPAIAGFTETDQDFLQLMARWLSGELERQQAAEALRKNHALLDAVLEGTTEAFFVKDLEGHYLMANRACAQLLGKSPSEIVGKTDPEIFPHDTSHVIRQKDEEILESGQAQVFEEQLSGADGLMRTYLTTKGPYRGSDGTVLGMFGNARDITERIQAEEKIRASEQQQRNILDSMSFFVGLFTVDGIEVFTNAAPLKAAGLTREDIEGRPFVDTYWISHSSGVQAQIQNIFERVKHGEMVREDVLVRVGEENFITVDATFTPLHDSSGHIYQIVGSACDVTERKKSEEALRNNEQALRKFYEITSTQMPLQQRLQALVKLGCQRFQMPIGLFSKVDNEMLTWAVTFSPDHACQPGRTIPLRHTLCSRVMEMNEPVAIYQVSAANRENYPIAQDFNVQAYLGAPIHTQHELIGTLCFLSQQPCDQSQVNADKAFLQILAQWIGTELERQRDEEVLKEQNHALSYAMPGIAQVDLQGCYTEVNESYASILGYDPSELIGTSWVPLVHPDDFHLAEAAVKALQEKGRGEYEARAIRKDGSIFYKQVLVVNRFNAEGEAIGCHCFLRDVTERREAEETIRTIIHTTSSVVGADFFRSLLQQLAVALNVKYAFITEYADLAKNRVKTLAFLQGKNFVENVEYDLTGTPCAEVMQNNLVHIPENVQALFPVDQDLVALNAESYIGVPLLDASGKCIGHLAVLSEQPMDVDEKAKSLLKIFAGRAGAEVERHRAEKALRTSEARLRQIIDLVPHLIFVKDREGRFSIVNQAVANIYGTTIDNLIGKTDADFNPVEEEVDNFRADDFDVLCRGEVKIVEEQITDVTTGNINFLKTYRNTFVFDDETVPSILGIAIDVTKERLAMQQLEEAYEQLREMTSRLKAAEESERKRIARELHDEFGQMLTGLKFDIAWLQRRISESTSSSSSSLLEKILTMATLTDQLIQTVRRIATSLRPSLLDDLGLLPALEWHVQEFQERTGIACTFKNNLEGNTLELDGNRSTALFRITQELFTNILRHANATQVTMSLSHQNQGLTLVVRDNGRGIQSASAKQSSLGLLGIKERASSFGGEFVIQGSEGIGTQATVFIPLQ